MRLTDNIQIIVIIQLPHKVHQRLHRPTCFPCRVKMIVKNKDTFLQKTTGVNRSILISSTCILTFGFWFLGFWILPFLLVPCALLFPLSLAFNFWILVLGFWLSSLCLVPCALCLAPCALCFGLWILGFGFWLLDFEFSLFHHLHLRLEFQPQKPVCRPKNSSHKDHILN